MQVQHSTSIKQFYSHPPEIIMSARIVVCRNVRTETRALIGDWESAYYMNMLVGASSEIVGCRFGLMTFL